MSSYIDRLQSGIITTPDFQRYVFEFEDVQKKVEFKTSTFTFSGRPGALVQNYGLGLRSFPLEIIFSGENYDVTSDNFEKSLLEKGSSLLEHPVYGNYDIIVESYVRSDALKTAAGQAIFALTVSETIIPAAPISSLKELNEFGVNVDSLIESGADAFSILSNAVTSLQSAASRITAFVKKITAPFEKIIATSNELAAAFFQVVDSILDGIGELIDIPIKLASAIQLLILLPAQAVTTVQKRIAAYVDILTDLIYPVEDNGFEGFNQRKQKQLFVYAAFAGLCKSSLTNTDYITKKEALDTATKVMDWHKKIQGYLDDLEKEAEGEAIDSRFNVNPACAYFVKNIASLTSGNLIRLAFTLRGERILYLENDTNMIPLVSRLYGGQVDEDLIPGIALTKLDFFIQSNELTPDEILMLPKDKAVRYYL